MNSPLQPVEQQFLRNLSGLTSELGGRTSQSSQILDDSDLSLDVSGVSSLCRKIGISVEPAAKASDDKASDDKESDDKEEDIPLALLTKGKGTGKGKGKDKDKDQDQDQEKEMEPPMEPPSA
jgi:cobalamin biosynthesis protein CobT